MWPSGTPSLGLACASVAVAATGDIGCAGAAGRWCSPVCICICIGGADIIICGATEEWRARRTDSSPSLISSSARLDLSSRSIRALILRRSMAASSVR